MGRDSHLGECCWCSSRNVPIKEKTIQTGNQVKLLLRLMGFSPTIVPAEDAGILCSDCSDLVDSGVAYQKGLEDVKGVLKQRTFARDSKTRSKRTAEDFTSKLGQKISKCFLSCYVQLEELALFQQDAAPPTSVSATIHPGPDTNETTAAIPDDQESAISPDTNCSHVESSEALDNLNLRLDEASKSKETSTAATTDSDCEESNDENLDQEPGKELKVEAGADLVTEDSNIELDENSNSNAIDPNHDATTTLSLAEEAVILDKTDPCEKIIKLDLEEELMFEVDDSEAEVDSHEYVEQGQLETSENSQSPSQLPHDGVDVPTPVQEQLETEDVDMLSNASEREIVRPSEETEENDAGGGDVLDSSSDADDVEVLSSDESSDADDPTYRAESPEPVAKRRNNGSTILKPSIRRTRASTKMVQQKSAPQETIEESIISVKVGPTRKKRPVSRSNGPLPDTTTTCDHCLLCTDNVPDTSEHLLIVHNLQRQYGNHYTCRMCQQAYLPCNPKAGTGLLITSDLERFKQFAVVHKDCSELLQETQEPQVCRFCDQVFTAGAICIIHEYEKHSDALSKYECFCTLCGEHFEHSDLLEDHVHRIHNLGKYSRKIRDRREKFFGCLECSAAFWSRRDLDTHIRQHSAAAISANDECLLCESHSESVVSLYGHYQSKHGLDFIRFSHLACTRCFEAFQSTSEPRQPSGKATKADIMELTEFVNKHLACTASNRNSAEQKCRYCLFTSLNAQILVDHEKLVHPQETTTEFKKCCDVCKLPCNDSQLTEHALQHKDDGGYRYRERAVLADRTSLMSECTKCSDQFGVASRFKSHQNIHLLEEKAVQILAHQPDFLESYCLICSYSTSVKNLLALHVEFQHNLTLKVQDKTSFYSCKHCDAPFEPSDCDQPIRKDLPAFKSFASEHGKCSREKFENFTCHKCQVDFQTLPDLQKHQFDNHPIKLQCHLCSSVFPVYSALKEHLVDAHSGVLDHACYRCGQYFKSFEKLCAHVAELESIEPSNLKFFAGFACLSCGLYFDSTELLALHMQEFHDYRKELTFSCRRCSQKFNSNELKANHGSDIEDTRYILNRNKKELVTFKTFTALCSQHYQDCTVQNISERCKRNLDLQTCCYVCEEPFESLQDLAAHLNGHLLGVKNLLKCPVCTEIFADNASLHRHTKKMHRIETYGNNYHFCHTCCEIWQSKTNRLLGQGELQPEDTLEFLRFAEFHMDCKESSPIVFQCKFCARSEKSPRLLFHHEIAKHTNDFPFRCEQCGGGFVAGLGLCCHLKSKGIHGVSDSNKKCQPKMKSGNNEPHFPPGDPHKCAQCQKQFWKLENLKKHEEVHEMIEAKKKAGEGSLLPHVCDECKKDFATPTALKIHRSCHRPKPKRPRIFVCHLCGKTYSSKADLGSHLHQVHYGRALKRPKKPRKPSVRFTETEEQRRERLTKKRNAMLKLCPECGKQYVGNAALQAHMNTHTGERSFVCKQCGKGFMALCTLQAHKAVHEENRERNVPCPQCDKKFFTKANADQHVRVFHNKLPWPCKIRSYKKWTPKNPEALAAAGIEYRRQDTDKEDTSDGHSN